MSETADIRITYRMARVLAAIASNPGASNLEVARNAGIRDEGQASKALKRLAGLGLIENAREGQTRAEGNAWRLTAGGEAVVGVIEAEKGW
jgi:predicted transcriptional regulator